MLCSHHSARRQDHHVGSAVSKNKNDRQMGGEDERQTPRRPTVNLVATGSVEVSNSRHVAVGDRWLPLQAAGVECNARLLVF